MNNIQKSFKRKSELRGMADGGSVRREIDPAVLGTGGAARAGHQIRNHNRRTAAEIDSLFEPAASPATQPAPAKKPEEKSALRSFFGLADGGQVFKNTVGGVPTFTDARAATAGATAHTPGSGGGTFSVIGMEPAQKQQMADAAAQRQAAANAPTTLGGRLDAALGKLNSPAATTGAPSSTPTLGSELDAAIGRMQGVTSAQTPATGAPANGAGRTMDPQKTQTFSGMSQAAATDAAQMRDIGVRAGEAAAAAARPASPLQSSSFDEPSFELEFADGGKVKGKGGPTDDKVGPVMLSDGEYVLPADTVDIVGRDNLDALRLATHDFVDEGNKPRRKGLRGMANGGVLTREDLLLRPALQTGGGGALIPPNPPTGTAMVPSTPPGGGGRGLVPHRPPTGLVPYEPPVTKLSPTEPPRPQAAGATSKFGNALRTGGGLLATGLEAKNVYDAYQSGGVDAAVPEAAMGATRLASAKLGATAGAALPLPGWGRPVAAGVGGVAGYMAPNAVANSEYMQEKGRESALRGAFSSRLDSEFAPKFDPRANTITTSDGRVFGSGRLESNPHLQYQGFLDAKAGQAVGSKDPLFNPTVDELDAIGALHPRDASAPTPATPPPQSATPVAGVLGPSTMADESNRRSGGGVDGRYPGAMENRSGLANSDPRINGSTSAAYNALSDDAVIGSFQGKPMTKREADTRAAGLQTASFMPPEREPSQMDQMRSLLREFGGGGSYGGGTTASARKAMADINKRYDDMLRDGSGRNYVRGLDWSQRHGLDLERARASELGEFARNQSALRGQDMQAAASANSNRTAALQAVAGMMERQQNAADRLQAAQLKALQDVQKLGMEGEEKGFERYSDAISSMFVGPDGKPDAAEQERFTSFLQASDPQAREKFAAMSPQDQMVLLQNFKTLYDMQKARNATAKSGGGAITNRADMPADVRESTWNDVWNNHLPVSDYLYSNLPFTNPNVAVTESGQPVLMSDYATTDGNWDADKLELIRQRTGKDQNARSALRGN